MTGVAPADLHPPRGLAAVALGGFLLQGLIYPVLGPALPTLSAHFGLRATGASALLSINSAGAVLGVLLAGWLARRLTFRQQCLLGAALIASGCLGLIAAPSFVLTLLASGLLGLGFGLLDLALNVWVSLSYGGRSAAMLNLLSASFGVGAVLAPLAVGLSGGNFRVPLFGCAALAALVIVGLLFMPPWQPQPGVVAPVAPFSSAARSPRLVLGLFILLFLAYVTVEGGVGSWEVSHLRDTLGLGTAAASRVSAWFWVSFTLGRLLSAGLALRLPPAHLIGGTLTLAALSLALATLPAAAPFAYTLAGLFLAPVFTTGLVWLTRVVPGGAAPTLVFAGAFLGPVLFSPLIGAMRDTFGPVAIPLTLMAVALLDLALLLGLSRQVRGSFSG
ncbi:MFS transporter [Deinococcus sp.]|uniref:MFS transporter n=1 Tax=Deinococcus sp. TaxID=47478 RepID=UPI003CC657CA